MTPVGQHIIIEPAQDPPVTVITEKQTFQKAVVKEISPDLLLAPYYVGDTILIVRGRTIKIGNHNIIAAEHVQLFKHET